MHKKNLYITVEEKEKLQALMKRFGTRDSTMRIGQKAKSKPYTH